ncbi:serine/threonine-protein kinase nekl-3 [Anaeramoeba flamelloides]|uniref:Serine/threonine-protein kinase nekl-3 n=1 Tax=Anaeramoeba flamelloides TaxID=1746091 RepID=A0AAV7ZNI7_9EUKA|nr:serine/threonine-protein kinase nekl-3 [Anaeramoeba flamelloides]
MSHQYILKINTFFIKNESLYLEYPTFIEDNLLTFFRSRRKFPLTKIVSILNCILTAINYLHLNKIYNLDLKLKNIILDSDFNIYLNIPAIPPNLYLTILLKKQQALMNTNYKFNSSNSPNLSNNLNVKNKYQSNFNNGTSSGGVGDDDVDDDDDDSEYIAPELLKQFEEKNNINFSIEQDLYSFGVVMKKILIYQPELKKILKYHKFIENLTNNDPKKRMTIQDLLFQDFFVNPKSISQISTLQKIKKINKKEDNNLLPEYWSTGSTSSKFMESILIRKGICLFNMNERSNIFTKISQFVTKSFLPIHNTLNFYSLKITKIQRIENLHIWNCYQRSKRLLIRRLRQEENNQIQTENNKGNTNKNKDSNFQFFKLSQMLPIQDLNNRINETYLFFPITNQNVREIVINGFQNKVTFYDDDDDVNVNVNVNVNGGGEYDSGADDIFNTDNFIFYENSSIADLNVEKAKMKNEKNSNVYSFLLCRVLLGNVKIIDKDQEFQCLQNNNINKFKRQFTSLLISKSNEQNIKQIPNQLNRYRKFVIWNQYQIYPEFCISYQRK